MNDKYGWHFRKKHPADTENERDDNLTFAESPGAESLLNEFGQNLHDEPYLNSGADSLWMVITIGTVADLHKPFVKSLFAGFKKHLEGAGSRYYGMLDCDNEIPFMALEDFGTRGLVGDINQIQADPPGISRYSFTTQLRYLLKICPLA